jgi:hypothetical protein
MNLQKIRDELAIVNSSQAFWRGLDDNFSRTSCNHDHGQNEAHFQVAGNFSLAQEEISQALEFDK